MALQQPLLFENETFWKYQTFESSYEFERVDIVYWRDLLQKQWLLAFYAAGIYLVAIFGLERYMKTRKAFNLRVPLILWNGGLGIFSIMGVARTAPVMLEAIKDHGVMRSICVLDFPNVQMTFWGLLFGISKFIELGDTLFIVLRKRPLQLLQWYHHIVTLIVVWITLPYAEPVGQMYIVMNYAVHAFMYPYFALKMAGIDVPKKVANMITTAQFAQMIAGFLLNALTIALRGSGYSCYRTPTSIGAFLAVYGSFMILFGKLFTNSVLKSEKRKAAKQA
ncbi:Elongation of very long chain fatty acids protein 6 [Orchesella cincta]|uniref:Elongation of very long chain fatty acids protein n=1 Tax=Orchesella cincta TaxID=48709 RepID=A0A1D2MJT7_ORCCI|nr:Elongation of very long chain fatty acids protein 6 [Orchesella cincta]